MEVESRRVGTRYEDGIYLVKVKHKQSGVYDVQQARKNEILQMTVTGNYDVDRVFFIDVRTMKMTELELVLDKGRVQLQTKIIAEEEK